MQIDDSSQICVLFVPVHNPRCYQLQYLRLGTFRITKVRCVYQGNVTVANSTWHFLDLRRTCHG